MHFIKNIVSRQIFDSRGNPTVETDVFLSIDLESDLIGHLVAFSDRIYIQSLQLRYYRGPGMGGGQFAAHYDRKSYQLLRDYFEDFFGTSIVPIFKLERNAQDEAIRQALLSFSRADLKNKKSIYGGEIDYILSERQLTNLESPVYDEREIIIYDLRRGERVNQ